MTITETLEAGMFLANIGSLTECSELDLVIALAMLRKLKAGLEHPYQGHSCTEEIWLNRKIEAFRVCLRGRVNAHK